VQLFWAQQKYTVTKTKNHSISFYVGANGFENYKRTSSYQANTRQTINPGNFPSFSAISNLFSLTYKYKKHEIIPVMYLGNYYTGNDKTKFFLMGGSLSYLYHFNQKPTHLFFEANFQTLFYTANNETSSVDPYKGKKTFDSNAEQKASIQTYILNPALGLEVKLWPLTYLQLAVGSGAYYTKGKPAISPAITSQLGMPDSFQNLYPGVFGLNWYARISIIVRAFNF